MGLWMREIIEGGSSAEIAGGVGDLVWDVLVDGRF